ncbi:MAG: hypothetical protein ABFR65_08750 [Pseudomonadota bacterium]
MKQIPNSWLKLTLNEFGEWRGGGTPAKSNNSFWSGNVPWVSPKDMKVSRITEEQVRIVSKIEELFSKIEEGERCLNIVAPIADKALGLATRLRQSILKKAFSGQLVEQDPNDEPVSVLLE